MKILALVLTVYSIILLSSEANELEELIEFRLDNPEEPIESKRIDQILSSLFYDLPNKGIADQYATFVKLSILEPDKYDSWAYKSPHIISPESRYALYDELYSEYVAHPSALNAYVLFCPAFYNDQNETLAILELMIQEEPVLAKKLESQFDRNWRPYMSRTRINDGTWSTSSSGRFYLQH